MNLRAIVLLSAVLLAALASAEAPPEKIWQPATTHPEKPPPATNVISPPPEIAAVMDWKTSFTTRAGDVWLGGGRQVAWLHRGKWSVFTSTNELGPEQPVGFAETPDGRIWCATPERVWQFDGRDWLATRSVPRPIHSLAATRDGTLWVATAHGLLRSAHGAWIVNGRADGLPADEVFSVFEDERGTIFAETANAWSRFEPDADTDAPRTEILSADLDHANIQEDDTITLRFQGRDKWDQTAPGDLLFSYRLDERAWSAFQHDTAAAFSGLGLGRHVFQRAGAGPQRQRGNDSGGTGVQRRGAVVSRDAGRALFSLWR